MKLLLIASMVLLSGCSQTVGKINTNKIKADRPAAITCPSSGLKKVDTDKYQTNQRGYDNLKICMSDVVRYIDESNATFKFYESK